MQIIVQLVISDGIRDQPIDVDPSDTILDLKTKIQAQVERTPCRVEEQQLTFEGKPLLDDAPLSACGIMKGSKIILLLNKAPQPPSIPITVAAEKEVFTEGAFTELIEGAVVAVAESDEDRQSCAAKWEPAMRAALNEAQLAVEKGNHPFGAVLVRGGASGAIALRAQNSVVTSRDPTCHAELNLVRAACAGLTQEELAEATLVTSTEPCPMCAGAIYWAGIGAVVYGCRGATLGAISGEELDVPCRAVFGSGRLHRVAVVGSVLAAQAAGQHEAFWPNWTGAHY